jgi:hypothetical protein
MSVLLKSARHLVGHVLDMNKSQPSASTPILQATG